MDAAHIAVKDAASGVRATARRRLPVQVRVPRTRILHAHRLGFCIFIRAYPRHHSARAETHGSKALRSDDRETQICF